jgi:hypothetical protein
MPNSFMKNIWRLRMMRRHRVNGFRLKPIRSLPIIISGFIKRLLALPETKRQQEQANAAVDDAVSGESRRDHEPVAENGEAGLPVDENANRGSVQANGGDGAAESGDAAPKKRRNPRNGAAKNGAANNGAANNGAEDRTNLSPAQLAEAVQGDQDGDQPS